ncbi:MAG: hypothetical protein L0Z50_18350 [Verrucomicrobiales bacterium]|nr:hypothetical protein [Verrucomicrobiales bacterium]
MHAPALALLLLLTICVSLAAYLDPSLPTPDRRRTQSAGLLETLMGDSRRLFATHFLLKADAYFHSGYYPGIFDEAKSFEESHISEETETGHVEPEKEHDHEEHEEESGFLAEPRDWIDRFSRHFYPSVHTHLDEGGANASASKPTGAAPDTKADVREMLPWLKLSSELDPNRVETYVVAAYWLRTRLGKANEAEQFLREGLRANPGDPALLFELGRVHNETKQDAQTTRNLWELALRRWQELEAPKKEPDKLLLSQIAVNLARLEEAESHYDQALAYWDLIKRLSPHPEEVDKRIAEVKAKAANQPQTRSPAR